MSTFDLIGAAESYSEYTKELIKSKDTSIETLENLIKDCVINISTSKIRVGKIDNGDVLENVLLIFKSCIKLIMSDIRIQSNKDRYKFLVLHINKNGINI